MFLAEDELLGRHVAIKVLLRYDDSHEGKARFQREARALARLSHPNLLAVHRAGEIHGARYIVSEFVRGKSLDQLELPLEAAPLARAAVAIAPGLAAAHRKGVLHRDLKPSNVLVSDEGELKICDFGIALLIDSEAFGAREIEVPPGHDAVDLTRDGAWVGTPRYIAPELWAGQRASARSDLFAFGALLYKLATGRDAIAGKGVEEVRDSALRRPIPPVREIEPMLDPRIASVVDRCLSREPEGRPASAEAVHAELVTIAAPLRPSTNDNPYRGLRPFELEHRGAFHGRHGETVAVVERLRSESFCVLAGDSGVGKSSLALAGVLPAVLDGAFADKRTWTTVTVRPGRRPLAELTQALTRFVGEGADLVAAAPREAARAMARFVGADKGIVIFVDQLEDLLTESDPTERDTAAALLAELAMGLPGIRVLASIRNDFLTRAAALPELGSMFRGAIHLVGPLDAEQLREAVEGPAKSLGYAFEGPEMVDQLVESVISSSSSLPLLQFALAELWERRDRNQRVLLRASLQEMGGVADALVRHAEAVLGGMTPIVRQSARRVLTYLVTADSTRANRNEAELTGGQASASEALQLLVSHRLVTARLGEDGVASFEIAHEALIGRWTTLRKWLNHDRERVVMSARIEVSAADWSRLGHSRAVLWKQLQLDEMARLGVAVSELSTAAQEFVERSRRAARSRRWQQRALIAALPLALLAVWAGLAWKERSDRDNTVRRALATSAAESVRVDELDASVRRSWKSALEHIDAGRSALGEWNIDQARIAYRLATAAYTDALRPLELALQTDVGRGDVRKRVTELLLGRALLAELVFDDARVQESFERIDVLGDPALARSVWEAPATWRIQSDPPGASLEIAAYTVKDGRSVLGTAIKTGESALEVTLPPGSYRLEARLEGRPTVYLPVLLKRGETLASTVLIPAKVPEGFVYIPAGRFLFGSSESDMLRRGDLLAEPQHEVTTPAYLIGRYEVLWQDWIDYLDDVPRRDRLARMPNSVNFGLDVDEAGKYRVRIAPNESVEYRSFDGQPIVYRDRPVHRAHDWAKIPVLGISVDEARQFAAWMNSSGRLPGARLCSGREWQRAARGADERVYPHGFGLRSGEANIDETYGRRPGGFGPDERGSYPASDSPFGVSDLTGNAWEFTDDGAVSGVSIRGGGFYHQARSALVTNRGPVDQAQVDADAGLRLCSSNVGMIKEIHR